MEKSSVKYKGSVLFMTGIAASLAIGWYAFPRALYKTESQPLQFNHKVHTEQSSMPCESCHEFAEDGSFKGIPTVSKCAECHSALLGSTQNEKLLVEQYITPQKEIPWKVYSRQPDNAYFSHAVHLKIGNLKCDDCHGPQGVSETLRPYQVNRVSGYSRDIWGQNISGIPSHSWEGMKMDRCVNCHQQQKRVDGCIDCHK
jgi:menaquinone reductase, multiheme cytochrome c subunit